MLKWRHLNIVLDECAGTTNQGMSLLVFPFQIVGISQVLSARLIYSELNELEDSKQVATLWSPALDLEVLSISKHFHRENAVA